LDLEELRESVYNFKIEVELENIGRSGGKDLVVGRRAVLVLLLVWK